MTRQFHHRMAQAAAIMSTALVIILLFGQYADAGVRRRMRRPVAPVYSQEGLGFSISLGRTGFDSELEDLTHRRSGTGMALNISYGLSNWVTLFGSISGNGYDSEYPEEWSSGYVDVGVKFSLMSAYYQRTQPYVTVSLGGAVLDNENDRDREYIGGSARLAGGLDHFLSPRTILFMEAGFRGGSYERMHLYDDTYKLIDEPEFHAVDLMFGLRFKL